MAFAFGPMTFSGARTIPIGLSSALITSCSAQARADDSENKQRPPLGKESVLL